MQQPDESTRHVLDYYDAYDEQARLSHAWGQIEYLRTQNIILRHLKPPPAVVLDVGGAAGRYACWLAREGYQVHLVDPVPLHIQQAQAASGAQPEAPIASYRLGDARDLAFDAAFADAVLLMGPLYHLVQARDRHQALQEAYRVLKRGGIVFAVGISRFASTIDGLASGYFLDPPFRQIMRRDLQDGQHRNPTGNPAYFTDTFFHHPQELRDEVTAAGFEMPALLAVEGISYMMQDFDHNWAVDNHREFLLELVAKTEQEPSLIGASPHLMCVAIKS
ncbi:MAG: class I SAM-dependent methyltransferase [Anaerolineae bacterium]|nr:class I SAM-dependent methyltransferase [Anaerolineae bacterium]